MNQVGYEKEWLYLLDFYVRPLQEAAFVGYYQKVSVRKQILYFDFLIFQKHYRA